MPAFPRVRAAGLCLALSVWLLAAPLQGQGEVVLGMSAAFTGASSQLGIDL
jgi:hypothetical protein